VGAVAGAPEVDDAFLRGRLAGFPDLLARPWAVLGGGLRTLNVRLGDVVARIGLDGADVLRKEAALLSLLRDGGRVPGVVDARTDGVLLLQCVEHAELPATSDAGARTGAAAASIHAHTFPAAGFLDAHLSVPAPFASAFDGLREWAEGMLAGAAGRRLGDLGETIARLWAREESRMRDAAAPVLVHSDFNPANVKWRARARDVVVFDS
jgi:hypothetical protein